ncbi:MAG: hypothetical protein IID33_12705, partial [Planctomycetes bacterium]|nr:hypothetical protein [Planctomycetota bacterium]
MAKRASRKRFANLLHTEWRNLSAIINNRQTKVIPTVNKNVLAGGARHRSVGTGPMTNERTLRQAYGSHPRKWRDFLYCYPVISRRSKGLSIGINLNPDGACNFDCVYCCVDRTRPPAVRKVDLVILENELRQLIEAARTSIFDEPEFRDIPPPLRRINDIAFSGDGEPTASPHFGQAAEIAAKIRQEFQLSSAKIITITDACFLRQASVVEALAFLDDHNGEIWAKLDAGTEAYFQLVDRPNKSLSHVLDNILAAARIRPIVIQSIFMRMHGQPPPAEERPA